MHEYTARCLRVIDGATFDMSIDLGFCIHHTVRVQLADCEAPSLRSTLQAEREHARQARDFCSFVLLISPYQIRVRTVKRKTGSNIHYLAEMLLCKDNADATESPLSLATLLKKEGMVKRLMYPSNAELIAEAVFARQADRQVMAEKRAMEGVATVDEKTPVE